MVKNCQIWAQIAFVLNNLKSDLVQLPASFWVHIKYLQIVLCAKCSNICAADGTASGTASSYTMLTVPQK